MSLEISDVTCELDNVNVDFSFELENHLRDTQCLELSLVIQKMDEQKLAFNDIQITKSTILLAANNDLSANITDLVRDVFEAKYCAESGDWIGAFDKSFDVAQDIIDIASDVGEAFIESRIDAVIGDYAENSDIGFQ